MHEALPVLEPQPVLAGSPALAANRVSFATVAARYSWNYVLARPVNGAEKLGNWGVEGQQKCPGRCSA